MIVEDVAESWKIQDIWSSQGENTEKGLGLAQTRQNPPKTLCFGWGSDINCMLTLSLQYCFLLHLSLNVSNGHCFES